MRSHWLALGAVVLWTPLAVAQQKPPQGPTSPAVVGAPGVVGAPALDPARNPLDALLVRWEKEMTTIQGLTAECKLTEVDRTFQATKVYAGTAKYMKPNLALMELKNKDKADDYKKYVCTGTFLYEFAQASKELRAHQLPPPKPGQVSEENFLTFLFGMRAEEAKRRYDLKLAKEDQYYFYVEILPRFDNDKVDFQWARLVLNKDTCLPRQLWFLQPNKSETTWDIEKVDVRTPLNRREFEAPAPPAGWKLTQVPRQPVDPAPRVVRPQK